MSVEVRVAFVRESVALHLLVDFAELAKHIHRLGLLDLFVEHFQLSAQLARTTYFLR